MERRSRVLEGAEGVSLRRAEQIEEFMQLFPLYEQAFPPAERRARDAFQAVFYDSPAEFWLVEQGGTVQGFLNTWRFDECLYGEHFAIFPAARGKRIGEHALRTILQRERLPFLIEVEPPADAISTRRKAFYERMGLQVVSRTYRQPAYERGGEGVQLYLMSSDGNFRGSRLRSALHALANHVYCGADVSAMLGESEEE